MLWHCVWCSECRAADALNAKCIISIKLSIAVDHIRKSSISFDVYEFNNTIAAAVI
jgi:hypothetical protein